MEKSFEKFLRKMLLEKYPVFLDVRVDKKGSQRIDVSDYQLNDCYEVFLVTLKKDWKDMENSFAREIKGYIKDLAKYMSLTICGVYPVTVDEDQWEEMKSSEED